MELKGKVILVTGGNSFLGKSLVPKLRKKGNQVDIVTSKDFNLMEQKEVRNLFELTSPDVVMHLAADNGGLEYTRDNPGSIFYNNVLMNTLVFEEAKNNNVGKFVGIHKLRAAVLFYPRMLQAHNAPVKDTFRHRLQCHFEIAYVFCPRILRMTSPTCQALE